MMGSVKPKSFLRDSEGQVVLGGCRVEDLVQTHGTPLYIMDKETVIHNCRSYTESLQKHYPNFQVVYAGKANLNIGLLNILAMESLGVDVVSGGELYTALQSKMNPENILFHGNNKSYNELKLAIENQVTIVLDNEQELSNIMSLASTDLKANVMVRLKPEIEAHTHDYIKTGQIDSKFGFGISDMVTIIKQCHESDVIALQGIHSHIGSQIFDIAPYLDLVDRMVGHLQTIKKRVGIEMPKLNLGGGIGIQYTKEDDPPEVALFIQSLTQRLISQLLKAELNQPVLILEPGRSIVGNAGVTVYSIGSIKAIPEVKTYLFVDGGMSDNPRPMMYQSEHTFDLVSRSIQGSSQPYAVAGKFCESGDVLAHDVMLPSPEVGDLLMVYGTGAYNYSMASNYNRACRPAMILVNNGRDQIMVNRESFEDLIRLDNQLVE